MEYILFKYKVILNWLRKKFIPKYKPNEQEQLILTIIQNLCKDPYTDIKMAPISDRYYLINKQLEYWIKVQENFISITNHKFTFTSHSHHAFHSLVVSTIRRSIEQDRVDFESTVFQNEVNLLKTISENIKRNNHE